MINNSASPLIPGLLVHSVIRSPTLTPDMAAPAGSGEAAEHQMPVVGMSRNMKAEVLVLLQERQIRSKEEIEASRRQPRHVQFSPPTSLRGTSLPTRRNQQGTLAPPLAVGLHSLQFEWIGPSRSSRARHQISTAPPGRSCNVARLSRVQRCAPAPLPPRLRRSGRLSSDWDVAPPPPVSATVRQ